MKTKKTLKALVLSLAMALGLLLPTTMNAQTDGFFRGGEDYENRDGMSLGGTSFENPGQGGMSLGGTTQENPLTLGSGLIIMIAAGGAYAITRRKH